MKSGGAQVSTSFYLNPGLLWILCIERDRATGIEREREREKVNEREREKEWKREWEKEKERENE